MREHNRSMQSKKHRSSIKQKEIIKNYSIRLIVILREIKIILQQFRYAHS